MLVFSTRLPLKDNITREDCLRLFIQWITESPNYSIDSEDIDYDLSSCQDFDYTKDNLTFYIRYYKDNDTEILACRLENTEPTAEWINDCIFSCENNIKTLMIQLNCNRTDFDTQLPNAHKPYIVRQFVENGYCKEDAGIPIIDSPLESDTEYYDTCVGIMNGTLEYSMPVVYVSCDYWGNTAISASYLAKQLSGIAHVFVEKQHETALKLRDDTNGNNAYTEYVGIYFPGTVYCQRHSLRYYDDYKAMSREIINAVWKALINRSDSSKYNWNHILALQARQKMMEWKDISDRNKDQLSDYIDNFDAENNELRCQVDTLNQEVYSLRAQLDILKAGLNDDSENRCFYNKGDEPSLYNSERSDLLYSILSQAQPAYKQNSRGYILIQSMLDANPREGECKRIMDGVNAIFNNGDKLNRSTKAQLKNLGFSIQEDGSHYKITFHDSRYMFTVSKTPSDFREGKNLVSQIRNVIDIERKI